MSPPPVVFVRAPGLLGRIREQITAPPDPLVLPWEPLPTYDEQAVAIRRRLDRAALDKKNEPPPPPRAAPTRVESSFSSTLPRPGATPPSTGGGVDFSTAGSFFQKAEVIAPARKHEPEPEPEPEKPAATDDRPAFGIALTGGRPKKKEEEKEEVRKRPRGVEENILQRLKTEFLKGE